MWADIFVAQGSLQYSIGLTTLAVIFQPSFRQARSAAITACCASSAERRGTQEVPGLLFPAAKVFSLSASALAEARAAVALYCRTEVFFMDMPLVVQYAAICCKCCYRAVAYRPAVAPLETTTGLRFRRVC